MKKSFFRRACMLFLSAVTFVMVMTRTSVKANSSVPGRVSAYASHENNQNNWGLFGIIGVIALAGITKRNALPKNE